MRQMLHGGGIDRHHMHVHAQRLAHLAARINQAGPMIQRKVHRLGVHDLAALAVLWHIAFRQHPRHIVFRNHVALKLDLCIQSVTARLCAGKTRDHMIDADAGHLLGCLQRGANGALCLAHRANFAKLHTA